MNKEPVIVLPILVSRITRKNLVSGTSAPALYPGTCNLSDVDFNRYGSGRLWVIVYATTLLQAVSFHP